VTAWWEATAAFWPVGVPLFGAALALAGRASVRFQRAVTAATLALLAAAALALLARVVSGGAVATGFGGWQAPLGLVFVADRLGAALACVTALIGAASALFARADLRRRQERGGFHPLFLAMLGAVNGAFLTGDLFNLYVWFELMLVTAVGLIVLDRRPDQIDGAIRYALVNVFGTIVLLAGIAILFGLTGTLTLAELGRLAPALPASPARSLAAVLLFAGFAVKAGLFPVYAWLPASYHTLPPAAAAAFAGLLTKVGVYALLRVFTLVFPDGAGIGPALPWIAGLTMVAGVMGAASAWDLRRVLSFHIVSQIGYMLAGLAVGTPEALAAAVFYVIHHIVVKANLFLVAGAVHRACGSYDLRLCGGLLRHRPALAVLAAVPILSLIGVPPFSGFWAKFLVVDAAFRAGHVVLGGVALWTSLLTLYSMSKVWSEAFWKAPRPRRPLPRAVDPRLLVPIGLLAAVTVTIGLVAEPFVAFAAAAGADLAEPGRMIGLVLGRTP
jgi:multicomponent Na+:H+ antiporter subunit D